MTNRVATTTGPVSPSSNDTGASLIVTIFGIVLLTVLGFGLTSLGTMATVGTVNERDSAETLAIADAGIAHARKLILWQEWSSLNIFLQNGNGTACDGDELTDPPSGALPTGFPTLAADFVPSAGRTFGRGQYRVFVCDDHLTDVDVSTGILDINPDADVNRRLLIRSVATGPGGAVAAVELVMGAQDLPAVIVNGPLRVPGNPQVTGVGGSIHSNGNLYLDGNPCAHMYYSSAGSVAVDGNSVGSGATCSSGSLDTRPDSAPFPLPILDPDMFKTQATYWLENSGQIRDGQTGAMIASLPGWNYNSGQKTWSAGTNIPAGTYWADANVSITGSPGTPASPLALTILAKYSIDIGGSPFTMPHLSITGPGMVATGLSMLAGTDLQLEGNSTQTFNSVYYAMHQLEIHGTPIVNGQVLAANLADTTYPPGTMNLVPLNAAGEMIISGTPTINFGGNGLVSTVPLSWRECRANPDPNNPCGALFGGP